MTAFLFNMPWSQVFDGSGNTLAGAKLYFYDAGTTTLKNIYADSDLTVAQSNPVIADAGGRFAPIYIDGNPFKVVLYNVSDNLIWSADNVTNQSVAESVEFALEAINKTLTSAGYTGSALTDSDNFPKAVFQYGNNALYYDNGLTDNKYALEPLGNSFMRPAEYFSGMEVIFSCARPNTSTTPTANVSGLGEVSIYRKTGEQVQVGEIYGTVHLIYDGNDFLLVEANYDQFGIGDVKTSLKTANHGGWLLCNGQAISRTDYAVLFALIGTNFGSGNGTTTFNVPDYRGMFLRGLGAASAPNMYTVQSEGLPNITGTKDIIINTNANTTTGCFSIGDTDLDEYKPESDTSASRYHVRRLSFRASDSNSIYGSSNHVTPYNMAVNYFIKAR